MELIQTLKTQHQHLEQLIAAIDAGFQRADAAEVARQVTALKRTLVAHLELEDKRLYPELISAAESRNEPAQVALAKMFSANMGRISEALLKFVGRFDGQSPADPARFASEWKTIRQVLVERVRSEEASLYPLYGRLTAPAKAKSA